MKKIKKLWRSTPASHLMRGGVNKDFFKSILDPAEHFLKQGKGSGWNPSKAYSEEEKKKKATEKIATEKIARMRGTNFKHGGKAQLKKYKCGGKTKGYAKGGRTGTCRGGGAATRGMKYGKDG